MKKKEERCYWCGRADLTTEPNRPNTRTKDHLTPQRLLKKTKTANTPDNVVISCRACNTLRGSELLGGVPGTCIRLRAFEAKRLIPPKVQNKKERRGSY